METRVLDASHWRDRCVIRKSMSIYNWASPLLCKKKKSSMYASGKSKTLGNRVVVFRLNRAWELKR